MSRQHDEHFLRRLERLEGEHAELALGLYYDSDLVAHILAVAQVPEAVDRVALCLGEPERGPHLIVARDGHFVTALGEDMVIHPDQFVIARHQLDSISEELESLRGLAADAKAGGRRKIRRRFERVYEAGPGLSRDEFDELVRWLPLLRLDFLRNQMDMIERCHELIAQVSGRGRAGRRQRQLTHEYWKASWAAAHWSMLLGGDGALELRRLLELLDVNDEGTGLTMVWTMVRLGASNFALRGAWLASKMPTLIVPHAKRRYLADEVTLLSTLTDSLSLSAVGMRHQKYRAEVGKTLDRGLAGDDPYQPLRSVARESYVYNIGEPELARQSITDWGRKMIRGAFEQGGVSDEAVLDQLDPAHGVTLTMMLPDAFCADVPRVAEMYLRLPWVVDAEARDFYLPEPYADLVRGDYHHEEGKLLTDARIAALVHKPAPARREGPKVGRNDPCPCGSGKKYKKCCLE